MSLSSSPERARGQRELWSSLPFPTTPRPPAPSPSYPLLEAPGNPSLSSFSPSSRRHFPSPPSSVNTVSSSPAPRCLRPPRAAPLPPRAPPLSPRSTRTLNRAGGCSNPRRRPRLFSDPDSLLRRFQAFWPSSDLPEHGYVFAVSRRVSTTFFWPSFSLVWFTPVVTAPVPRRCSSLAWFRGPLRPAPPPSGSAHHGVSQEPTPVSRFAWRRHPRARPGASSATDLAAPDLLRHPRAILLAVLPPVSLTAPFPPLLISRAPPIFGRRRYSFADARR
jgi:hypothetical protein